MPHAIADIVRALGERLLDDGWSGQWSPATTDRVGQRRLFGTLIVVAIAAIVVVLTDLFGDVTDRGGSILLLAALIAISTAGWLISSRFPRVAVMLVGLGIMGIGAGVGLVFEGPAATFAPVVGFAIVAPELRGRALPAFAALAAVMAGVIAFGTIEGQRDLLPRVTIEAIAGTALVAVVLARHLRRSRTAIERYTTLVEDLPFGIVRATQERLLDVNEALVRLMRAPDRETVLGLPPETLFAVGRESASILERLAVDEVVSGETELRRLDDTTFWARYKVRRVARPDGATRWYEATVEDITAERAASVVANQLAAVVESANEAISTTSLDGRILNWNRGAERIYGWSAEDAVGRSIEIVLEPGSIDGLRETYRRIVAGEHAAPFETERIRRDGSSLTMLVSLSPVHGADGSVVAVSGIGHDLTEQRALEARVARGAREREDFLRTLVAIAPDHVEDGKAESLCRSIATTTPFTHVGIAILDHRSVRGLACWSGGRSAPDLIRTVGEARDAELIERAASGPWVEELPDDLPRDVRRAMRSLDVRALAFVPITNAGERIGLLIAGVPGDDVASLTARLPVLLEFATVSGALIGSDLIAERMSGEEVGRLREIISSRAFHPVFQPVVELRSGAILGYEALTRFADGTPPDQVFAAAVRAGLGIDLEVATIEAALEASGPLPANVFLDMNVSPGLLLAREPLRTLLRQWGWGVVLEVTEHTAIEDYAAVRQAISEIGTNVRLAVDDAGAGFSSLRHVLELRPAFIKLDRTLIAGIDADPARQALVAGMHHIATDLGSVIVAEGVETEAERATLIDLGAGAAQGYLFGRPRRLGEAPPAPRVVPETRSA